jgi:hypothetical protein
VGKVGMHTYLKKYKCDSFPHHSTNILLFSPNITDQQKPGSMMEKRDV